MNDSPQKHGIFWRLYHGETAFDFVGRKRLWFVISGVVIALGVGSLATRHLNLGIDFRGGTAWEVDAPGVSVARARDALRSEGLAQAKIQILGRDRLRVQADVEGSQEERTAKREKIARKLAAVAHTRAADVGVNEVGASWGGEITRKAERALVFFFVAITLYISLRFEWKMAAAALAALVHDILVTVGIYSLSGFEVTPATVIAFLTILGYSLYDTIVVFDKVEENTRGLAASGRMTYGDTVNLSMNQVLMRSLNTSLVAILPILSILVVGAYILGATTLEDFGLALLIGLLTGAYSSIFIASPLLAVFKEREPRYAAIKTRLATRSGQSAGVLTPAAAAAAAGVAAGTLTPADGSTSEGDERPKPATKRPQNRPAARPHGRPAPRGRKKRRR